VSLCIPRVSATCGCSWGSRAPLPGPCSASSHAGARAECGTPLACNGTLDQIPNHCAGASSYLVPLNVFYHTAMLLDCNKESGNNFFHIYCSLIWVYKFYFLFRAQFSSNLFSYKWIHLLILFSTHKWGQLFWACPVLLMIHCFGAFYKKRTWQCMCFAFYNL